MVHTSDITQLINAWSGGDTQAPDQLFSEVFSHLRDIARRHLDREAPGHTLQPTAVVNELYMRLIGQRRVMWSDRREFFAVASKLIRRILVDHARKRLAVRRSGGEKISLDETLVWAVEEPRLLELDDALSDLEKFDSRSSRVVELHTFGGLSFDEIAEVLGVSRITTLRDWKHAKLWLRRQLRGVAQEGSGDL